MKKHPDGTLSFFLDTRERKKKRNNRVDERDLVPREAFTSKHTSRVAQLLFPAFRHYIVKGRNYPLFRFERQPEVIGVRDGAVFLHDATKDRAPHSSRNYIATALCCAIASGLQFSLMSHGFRAVPKKFRSFPQTEKKTV